MEQKTTMGKIIRTIGGVAVAVVALAFIIMIPLGYYHEWQWTGLPATHKDSAKTLWDWFELLIIPLVLAIGAWWFRKGEADSALKLEEQRAQEIALEAYLDRMSDLLLDKENPL